MSAGVDYAWSHPGGAALQRAGMRFACRYLSHDTTGKNLTRAEADDLAAHGVACVVVWETTARRVRDGRAAGIEDAKDAVKQATAAGMPKDRPIYFAIDYDAPEKDQTPIDAYFRGVASVIGLARTGAYGGYWPLSRLKGMRLARWFWQTDAWSGSNLLAGRHIHQHAATVTIAGVSCDKDTALVEDFGQWMPGRTPDIQEDIVQQISDEDVERIAKATARQAVTGVAGMHAPTDRTVDWALSSWIQDIHAKVTALEQRPAPEIDYAKLAAALIAAVTTKGA
jgi:hypothetical protein